jgi:RHS repeat-associated protein
VARGRAPTVTDTAYDVRGRPVQSVTQREPFTDGSLEDDIDRPVHEQYTWDGANNLTQVLDLRDPDVLGPGIRPPRRKIHHDALYRVIGVALDYRQDDATWGDDLATDWRDQRTRSNNDGQTHEEADPMRERPAAMVPNLPSSRVRDLTYNYDWLANMVEWYDDASSFYERSLGRIDNGFDEAGFPLVFGSPTSYKRPSALYLATNISEVPPESYDGNADRGGWVWLDYGLGGNVEAMTVRARCADEAEQNRCYDDTSLSSFDNRNEHLRTACRCLKEQHYQYRWDEVNRLVEARRYDRGGSGDWQLAVRQRYRYDGNNQRIVKQTLDANPALGDPPERVALYIQPGNFERRGLTTDYINVGYAADPILGTETQYQVGGSRIVWKTHDAPTTPGQPERTHRVTYALTDLIQSTSAVIDLYSGALLEMSTFYPNGAQETHHTTHLTSMAPEPTGFTGKEADEEVGVTYFGERYLIPRIGRWASPDPLSIHAAEGGEVGNGYHYVSGNLLQARDPIGLDILDALERGFEYYNKIPDSDPGKPLALELMKWRLQGFGRTYTGKVLEPHLGRSATDPRWQRFLSSQSEITSAVHQRLSENAQRLASLDPGTKGAVGFGTEIDVVLNRLESMRLTLNDTDVRARHGFTITEEEGVKYVTIDAVRLQLRDRGDLHEGVVTRMNDGSEVDDKEFMGAGWDYDIRIDFTLPEPDAQLKFRVNEDGTVTQVAGWRPESPARPSGGTRSPGSDGSDAPSSEPERTRGAE